MAQGTINDKKINVTGFTPSTDEEIYRVSVSGTSTAESSPGKTIESNIAIVRHEKEAKIELSTGGTPCSGYDYALVITSVNIVDGTLQVSSYPSWVSEYTLTGNSLCYNLYPNYDNISDDGSFVVVGFDEYGNLISSNPCEISPGEAVVMGSITWNDENPTSVTFSTTGITLRYSISGPVKPESIVICETGGEILGIEITTGDVGGSVVLHFSENDSENFEKMYTVKICGVNRYNTPIESKTFAVTQGVAEGVPDFYLTGDDIEWDSTEVKFTIHADERIVPSSIAIVNYSDTFNSCPQITSNYEEITGETSANTAADEKILSVSVSASTEGGRVVFASGVVKQRANVYLWVYDDSGNMSADVTSETRNRYYEQTRLIVYTSRNAGTISASFISGFGYSTDGTLAVDQIAKTVTVNIGENNSVQEKKYKIKLSSSIYSNLSATYEFIQEKGGRGGIILSPLKDIAPLDENSGVISSNTIYFELKVEYDNLCGYNDFGVSLNSSDSPQFKVFKTDFNGLSTILKCWVYMNTTHQTHYYNLQVSANTIDISGTFKTYSNVFTIKHLPDIGEGGEIYFTETGDTVESSSSTYSVNFYCSGLTDISVCECIADDGSSCNAIVEYFPPSESGTCEIEFAPYPAETRHIRLMLMGVDGGNNIFYTNNASTVTEDGYFVLEQKKAPGAKLNVTPKSKTLSYDEQKQSETRIVEFNFSPENIKFKLNPYDIKIYTIGAIYRTEDFDSVVFQQSRVKCHVRPREKNDAFVGDKILSITFSGTSEIDNSPVYETVTITLKPKGCGGYNNFIISSDSRYYDETAEKYFVPAEGGNYPLTIDDSQALDRDREMKCIVSPNEYGAGNSMSVTLYAIEDEYEESLTGYVSSDGNSVIIPVGNYSSKYQSKTITINKNEGTVVDDRYEFYVYLDRKEKSQEVKVNLSGSTYCGGGVVSNILTFFQSGIPAPGISLSPSVLNVPVSGGEFVVQISVTDGPWIVYKSPDWLEISPNGGYAKELTVTVQPNTTGKQRGGPVVFLLEAFHKYTTLVIVQEPN